MPSVFPELSAYGVYIRDAAGNPIAPAPTNVERAYAPPATFASNCQFTALPSDCLARLEPKQLNAIVSELVALAECWDPDGPWDCNSLNNLCTAFNNLGLTPVPPLIFDQISIVGAGTAANPLRALVYVADAAPPITPTASGMLWWNSTDGQLYVLYNDGNSTQWVGITGGGGGGSTQPPLVFDNFSIVGTGTAADPLLVGTIDGGNY